MPAFPTTSSAARTALAYITAGALIVIWTGVWYVYLLNNDNPQGGHGVYYWVAGLAITGVTLIGIGLGLGRIGSSARQAEIPVHAVVPPVVPATVAAASNGVQEPPVAPQNTVRPPVATR
jgi:hypothetical protein